MISVGEALEKILSYVSVLEPEEKPILEALGQILAEDVAAPFSIPPLDNAAMDGYAVAWESVAGASPDSPRALRVIGEVAAGYLAEGTVGPGQAIRIMTGAPVPSGADTVIPFEDTDEQAQRQAGWQGAITEISVRQESPRGGNIRRAGEDVSQGSLVFEAGIRLRPAEIGVLASLGRAKVKVIRRPVVAILATGDELAEVGDPLPPGHIYNSNSYSVASLVRRYGGIPRSLGIARDNVVSLTAKVEEGLSADMLITSAGVSTGDYDMVKDVLAQQGEISFWTVRMKPGKPLAFGFFVREGRTIPHLGLPGNPVSSMITFEQFARPALLKMMGLTNLAMPTIQAIFQDRLSNSDGRRVFARAIVTQRNGQYYASLTGPQGSGILTSMALANGLVIVPEEKPQVRPGDLVMVQMLDWNQDL